jgi:hypothetical protein
LVEFIGLVGFVELIELDQCPIPENEGFRCQVSAPPQAKKTAGQIEKETS